MHKVQNHMKTRTQRTVSHNRLLLIMVARLSSVITFAGLLEVCVNTVDITRYQHQSTGDVFISKAKVFHVSPSFNNYMVIFDEACWCREVKNCGVQKQAKPDIETLLAARRSVDMEDKTVNETVGRRSNSISVSTPQLSSKKRKTSSKGSRKELKVRIESLDDLHF